MGASGIWSGRMLGVVAGILIVFGALSYGPTSHYTQRLRSSEQTTVTTGGGISSIFEFLQRPPSERRAGIFNAIKCAGNHTMEVFKPKPRTTPLPKPTPPPSPSPPSPVSLLNRPKQESVIVVNKHNPWVRFAVVAGMSGLFYKGIEHVVSNPVVHSYCKQHMPRLTQFYDKDILDKIRHLGACIRRSEGLSPLVDTLVGMRVPGTRKDGLKVHSITDQGTHLTTLEELVGDCAFAMFAIPHNIASKDSRQSLKKIASTVAALKAYGVEKVVCIVKDAASNVKRVKEEEGIPSERVILLADPSNKINRALGVSIGNSGLVVDKKLTVTSIHTPTLKPDGSLQDASGVMLEYLVDARLAQESSQVSRPRSSSHTPKSGGARSPKVHSNAATTTPKSPPSQWYRYH